MLILTDVARILGRQGLPFCRAGEAENDDGNFKQIVNLLSRHNSVFIKWLNETASRSHYVTYLSKDSQNEFIQLLGEKTREIIIEEIKKAGIHSVIADITSDLKHHDHLTLNVRYVIEEVEELKAKECLFKMNTMLTEKS